MELICPVCQATLQRTTPGTARCATHGGEFKILFDRHLATPMDTPPPLPPLPLGDTPPVATAAPPPVPRFADKHCVQHPAQTAIAQCRECGAYLCATCDFALPNGVHLCPACATSPRTDLQPKQKTQRNWSYVCAAAATVGFIGTMGAARSAVRSPEQQSVVGLMFMFFVLLPAIIGVALGSSARDRRYKTPFSLWGAIIWNGLLLGLILLLMLIGMMR